ncbi:hypothetical protein H5410_028994 [Solanum commersonii]|uniref:Uncharacterized protein n=1 Tax=Solanum commersonii TaxID=4109 RepID=A0A9J5Z981_SOLCO|nr:hypothetical protein H5410_028994 [Solanum commersonii]
MRGFQKLGNILYGEVWLAYLEILAKFLVTGDFPLTLPRLLDAPSLENMHVKVVSCGARHTAVVTGDSKVFCWGWNKYGQLGLGDVVDRNIPSQVSMDGHVPINVACGWWHTLLLAESPT